MCRIRFLLLREVHLHSTFEARHGVPINIRFPIKVGVAEADAAVLAVCSETVATRYVGYDCRC